MYFRKTEINKTLTQEQGKKKEDAKEEQTNVKQDTERQTYTQVKEQGRDTRQKEEAKEEQQDTER